MNNDVKASIIIWTLIISIAILIPVLMVGVNQTYERTTNKQEYIGIPISIDEGSIQHEIVWMDDNDVLHYSWIKPSRVIYKIGTERSIVSYEVHGYNDFGQCINTYDEWVITAELEFFNGVL